MLSLTAPGLEPAATTTTTFDSVSSPVPQTQQHNYGTRTREHSRTLKPTSRLRQSPEPQPTITMQRKIKIVPKLHIPNTPLLSDPMATFPFPGVMLHPEDANSKVFLAIGRSFLSVDNRAMTIKDLAEMTIKFGLVCQNVSAASQAITTYIRNHTQRCEVQGDCPLLLRHTLSGTPSDDDLFPALHSLTGGAHMPVDPITRKTNFRRGTVVWFLSRATGAPCPFARVGVQLADYGEHGKDAAAAEKKRERLRDAEQSGQKRKRALRGHGRAESDQEDSSVKPPPKVRLTLRLKPSNPIKGTTIGSLTPQTCDVIDLSRDTESDRLTPNDAQASDDSCSDAAGGCGLPPYPRRSIDIPCYTPTYEGCYPIYPSSLHAASPYASASSPASTRFRRSPSIPLSVASAPPDSDDEIGFPASAISRRLYLSSPSEDESEDDEDEDARWESPGPRSPEASGSITSVYVVKPEPRDVQGLLDAWDMDQVEDTKAIDFLSHSSVPAAAQVKVEELTYWDWHIAHAGALVAVEDWFPYSELTAPSIKTEDLDIETTIPKNLDVASSSFISLLARPESPVVSSPMANRSSDSALSRRASEVVLVDVEVLGPDSVDARDFEDGAWENEVGQQTLRVRTKTVPELPVYDTRFMSHTSEHSASNIQCDVIPRLLPSQSAPSLSMMYRPDVIETSLPCFPAITATCLEGVPVYQTTLNGIIFLRRVDTDYVNMSAIFDHYGGAQPIVASPAPVAIITEGSPMVCGTWVPLSVAQAYVTKQNLSHRPLVEFLSDLLSDRFPPTLKRLGRLHDTVRLYRESFGSLFESTAAARKRALPTPLLCDVDIADVSWTQENSVTDRALPYELQHVVTAECSLVPISGPIPELPLSKIEQEIFQEFCVGYPLSKEETEQCDNATDPFSPEQEATTVIQCEPNPPLRRSKRNANPVVPTTRSRTSQSRKR